MNKTNLEAVKDVAKQLLDIDVVTNQQFPFIVSHPFFNSSVVSVETTDGNKLVNIIENEENLKLAKDNIKLFIDNVNTAFEIFMIANKPYQPAFLKFMKNNLSEEDYAEILRHVWTNTEYPNHDANIKKNEWLSIFKKANRCYLMDNDDIQVFENLPNEVTIYRGFYNEKYYDALSWTLDKEKAKWFANRFNQNGAVYKAKIEKKKILAYFDTDEKEVVVDYKFLIEPKKINK